MAKTKKTKDSTRPKLCYIYTRVSTVMQVDGYSLEAQETYLRREAEHKGYQVVKVFSDQGKSGKNTVERDAFNEMISRITNGNQDNVEYVYVYKISRFGRNAADIMSNVQLMEDYGVKLYAASDNIDSAGGAGKLIISIMAAVAEGDREMIMEQTMSGRIQKARKGEWNGGQSPFGYKLNRNTSVLEIDEEEAAIVRLIYDMYLNQKKGMNGIAKWLNLNGYRKKIRGNGKYDTFTAHTIKLILDNPVYYGKMPYRRRTQEKIEGTRNQYHRVWQDEYDLYDGKHEAIIDQATWEAVHERRKLTGVQNDRRHGLDHYHMVTGILKCPICGAPMYGRPGRKRRKDGSYYENSLNTYYYCCKHERIVDDKPCGMGQINQRDIDAEVWDLMSSVLTEGGFDHAIQEALDNKSDPNILEERLKALQDNRHRAVLLKDRRADEIDRLDITSPVYEMKYEDLQKRLDASYEEIVSIDKEIKEVQSEMSRKISADATMKDAHALLEYLVQNADRILDEEAKRDVVHDFVREIQIYPKKTDDGWIREITFNFSVVLNGEESRSFQHCDTTVETVVLLSKMNTTK